MDEPRVVSALYWLSWIEFGTTVALALVAIGVGYEFLADRIAAPFRRTVEEARQRQVQELNVALEQSRVRVEELRRDNLETQRRIQPRDVAPEMADAFVGALRPQSGQRFWISASASDGEQVVFAIRLWKLLVAAGWIPRDADTGITYGAALGLVVGANIIPGSSAKAVEAGKALWQALRGVDIAANLMPVATAAENDVIWINIGVKPLPELTITATASGEAKSEGAATATVK